MNQRTKYLG